MVFSSTVFLFVFLPVILILYYNPLIKSRGYRNIILCLTSLAFYAWGEPVFVLVMLCSIFVNWLLGIRIEQSTKYGRNYVFIALLYNVSILFWFKYAMFFAKNISMLFHKRPPAIQVILPIGISFFTFQLISYILDIYYGKCKAQKNVLYVGLYISMFPQLIAGPIVRYETIEHEILHRKESMRQFKEGMLRFAYGLGKKVLLSNYLGMLADAAFACQDSQRMSVGTAWLGGIAYTLQIYYDFSGYSDMAIGLGAMFGFHFLENFNYPYISKSITEFWRRWHISLSTWFRDYVYIPLGGNREGKSKWIRNLFVVWLLTGIWHGANWTFIIWGLLYFCLLLIEKITGLEEKLGIFSRVYTIIVIILLWVLFRADSMPEAVRYWGWMFGADGVPLADRTFLVFLDNAKIILLIACIFSAPAASAVAKQLKLSTELRKNVYTLAGLAIFLISLVVCIQSMYNPFIYFNF